MLIFNNIQVVMFEKTVFRNLQKTRLTRKVNLENICGF